MKTLIRGARVLDPASGFDQSCDVALANGKVSALGGLPEGFVADRVVEASGLWLMPGLVDLATRLREPGHEHEGMLATELAAAAAGGITSVVCQPDTDPVLDEPGLVEMLRLRAERQNVARVYALGALTRGLRGEVLTEMQELSDAGCIGFGQAEVPLVDTQVLQRALQYASTFGHCVWLRPQDMYLGKGVAASGALATRMGLSGVPVAAETIALHTIFELVRATQARVHLCRLSSAAGVDLVRQARASGLPISCDVSINSLHLTELDIGYYDSRARLSPPLRQMRDRQALRQALAEGTIDALVSDHTPVAEDAKMLPFAEAEPGATGVELLLSLALKWSQEDDVEPLTALRTVTSNPAAILGTSCCAADAARGRIVVGADADLCLFDPNATWTVAPAALLSQGKHTPFQGYELPGRVRYTFVGGHLAHTLQD